MNNRRAEAQKAATRGKVMPTGLLVARFIRFYGMNAWANPAWPTRDGFIPYQLFFVLMVASVSVSAGEQFDAYFVALLAGAMRNADEAGRASLQQRVDELLATAYPEVGPPDPAPAPPSKIVVVSR